MTDTKIDSAVDSLSTHTGDVVEDLEINIAAKRRVLRKIDRVVLPLMCMIYFFQCKAPSTDHIKVATKSVSDLDKQSIGYAAVFGLAKDLHMNAEEYSWALSIFYFGQFFAEYAFIYLMSRLPLTKFVGIFV